MIHHQSEPQKISQGPLDPSQLTVSRHAHNSAQPWYGHSYCRASLTDHDGDPVPITLLLPRGRGMPGLTSLLVVLLVTCSKPRP